MFMHRPLLEKERNNEKDSLVRIAQQCTHSIKMNTNNRREKIQGGILAKGVIDDCMCTKRVCAPRENTENEGSEFLLTKYRFI